MVELKPCPFCGGEAEYYRSTAGGSIRCTAILCGATISAWHNPLVADHWNTRATDARIAELKARAEKAEAALRKIDTFELMDRLGLSDAFKKYSEQLGWGLTPYQPECWAALDAAVAELARLRVAGTFNEGIEAATKWIVERRDNYTEEHGSFDWETGATEFGNSAKEDYVAELDEIEEGLRALRREGGA